ANSGSAPRTAIAPPLKSTINSACPNSTPWKASSSGVTDKQYRKKLQVPLASERGVPPRSPSRKAGARGRFAGNGQWGGGGPCPAALFFFRLERRAPDSRTYDISGNVNQALLARGGREMNGFT